MVKILHLNGNVIVNISVANQLANGDIEAPANAEIGDSYANGVLTKAQPSAESLRLAGLDAAIGGDTTIQQLKAMSAADFDTWWAANATTLAQANNVLKRIARIVLRRLA